MLSQARLTSTVAHTAVMQNSYRACKAVVGEHGFAQVLLQVEHCAACCNIDMLPVQAVGVELNKKGAIVVDKYSHTNVDSIWAIGVRPVAFSNARLGFRPWSACRPSACAA